MHGSRSGILTSKLFCLDQLCFLTLEYGAMLPTGNKENRQKPFCLPSLEATRKETNREVATMSECGQDKPVLLHTQNQISMPEWGLSSTSEALTQEIFLRRARVKKGCLLTRCDQHYLLTLPTSLQQKSQKGACWISSCIGKSVENLAWLQQHQLSNKANLDVPDHSAEPIDFCFTQSSVFSQRTLAEA